MGLVDRRVGREFELEMDWVEGVRGIWKGWMTMAAPTLWGLETQGSGSAQMKEQMERGMESWVSWEEARDLQEMARAMEMVMG